MVVKVIDVSTSRTVPSSVSIMVIVAIASLVPMACMSTKSLVGHMSSTITITLVVVTSMATESLVGHMALAITTRSCFDQCKDCNQKENPEEHIFL